MLELTIGGDIQKLADGIKGDAKRHAPFGVAYALTLTAKDARGTLVKTLPDYFTVRSSWVANSMRHTPARKGPNPEASVGTQFAPMDLQTIGGKKAGKDGGDVAVPYRARRTTEAKTRPASWPGRLLAIKAAYFHVPSEHGGELVYQRIGKGGRHLRLWWVLAPVVRVKPRWPFAELVGETIKKRVQENFERAMDYALKTAKP